VSTSCLVNRNVTAMRGRTSMRLEPELWDALEEICQRENLTLADVVKQIERLGHPGGRTSAVRVHVMTYFRRAATESGHRLAGHGSQATASSDWTQPSRAAAPPS
jgi:predicted DNA-binding ribbon-helix-helix protein